MPETERHSFEASARRLLTKFDVPDGDASSLFIAVGAANDDRSQDALQMIVLQRAFMTMYKAMEELYTPKTPLEAQLEYEKVRPTILKEFGFDRGPWTAEDTPAPRPVCDVDGAVLRNGACPFCDPTE